MTLSARPLLDNAVDAKLFVDRQDEIDTLFTALRHGWNIAVFGEAGSGKTSLIRHLMYRARTDPAAHVELPAEAVTYVSAEGVLDPAELLRRIIDALADGLLPARTDISATDKLLVQLGLTLNSRRDRFHLVGMATFDDSDPQRRRITVPVIIVEDVTRVAAHGLFGSLRDRLWELGCQWIVTARASEGAGILQPPADAFFESVTTLGPLTPESARDMIGRRRDSSPGTWPDNLVQALGGNPRRVLAAAREVIANKIDFGDVLDAIALRNAEIERLGESHVKIANALESLGSASASDPQLLNRLEWTRARAVQLLTDLAAAGLVQSDDVKQKQGRPRRVYRLTPALDYVREHGPAAVS